MKNILKLGWPAVIVGFLIWLNGPITYQIDYKAEQGYNKLQNSQTVPTETVGRVSYTLREKGMSVYLDYKGSSGKEKPQIINVIMVGNELILYVDKPNTTKVGKKYSHFYRIDFDKKFTRIKLVEV